MEKHILTALFITLFILNCFAAYLALKNRRGLQLIINSLAMVSSIMAFLKLFNL